MRREFIDYDYARELKQQDPEALAWLAKFNGEFYGAAITKDDRTGYVKKGHIHTTQKQAKEIFDDNNRRNNDVLGVSRVNIGLSNIDSELDSRDGWYISNVELTENAAVAELDAKRLDTEILTKEEYLDLKGNMTMEMLFYYEGIYGDEEK